GGRGRPAQAGAGRRHRGLRQLPARAHADRERSGRRGSPGRLPGRARRRRTPLRRDQRAQAAAARRHEDRRRRPRPRHIRVRPGGLGARALSREVAVEEAQQAPRAVLAELTAVEAVEERALLGEGEPGAVAFRGELHRGHRHRGAGVVDVHLVRVDDPLVRDDVLVDGLVAVAHVLDLALADLAAADAEVELQALVAAGPPALLLAGIGPRRVDALGRGVVAAVEGEGVMGHGHHWAPFLFGVLGEVVAEAVEAALPARATLGDPLLGRPQRLRLDLAGPHAAHLVRLDQPARLQHLDVLD